MRMKVFNTINHYLTRNNIDDRISQIFLLYKSKTHIASHKKLKKIWPWEIDKEGMKEGRKVSLSYKNKL